MASRKKTDEEEAPFSFGNRFLLHEHQIVLAPVCEIPRSSRVGQNLPKKILHAFFAQTTFLVAAKFFPLHLHLTRLKIDRFPWDRRPTNMRSFPPLFPQAGKILVCACTGGDGISKTLSLPPPHIVGHLRVSLYCICNFLTHRETIPPIYCSTPANT